MELGMVRNRRNDAGAVAQYTRFAEASRQLGCDESEELFDAALRKVAKVRPAEKPKPSAADQSTKRQRG